jgi:hypothetical protein
VLLLKLLLLLLLLVVLVVVVLLLSVLRGGRKVCWAHSGRHGVCRERDAARAWREKGRRR